MISEEITKGPWVINPDRHPLDLCVEVIDEKSGRLIAILYSGGEDSQRKDGFWGAHPIRDANARLIVAAPDLLAALKALFASYKELADSGDAGFWKLEDCPEGKQALEAIAKAEGEAS